MYDWSNKPVVVIASGPGLTEAQCVCASDASLEEKVWTISVNDSWSKSYPDVAYAGDFLWWKVYHQDLKRNFAPFRLWTQDAAAHERFGINRVRGVNRSGLGENCIYTGGNSGYQAINLAYLWKAKKIILLGFTMREIDGKKHWHADHPKPLVQQILPGEWRHKFDPLAKDLEARGVEVVNCDPLSALTCFRMSTIEKELP